MDCIISPMPNETFIKAIEITHSLSKLDLHLIFFKWDRCKYSSSRSNYSLDSVQMNDDGSMILTIQESHAEKGIYGLRYRVIYTICIQILLLIARFNIQR